MSTKRPSLRDREAQAFVNPSPEPEPVSPAAPQQPRRRPAPARQGTVRLGAYWQPGTFEEAKRGYLADLDTQPDSPGSFAGWIDRAIRQHALRGARRRQQIAAQLGAEPVPGRGSSRSFNVAASTVDAMEAAVADDRRHGRITSRTGFIAEAVRAAVAEARDRYGAELPPAPQRLPTRPPR